MQDAIAAGRLLQYPNPTTLVPRLDSNGVYKGTSRLIVSQETGDVLATTNSASPQSAWPVQMAEWTEKAKKLKANKDKSQKPHITSPEKIDAMWERHCIDLGIEP